MRKECIKKLKIKQAWPPYIYKDNSLDILEDFRKLSEPTDMTQE